MNKEIDDFYDELAILKRLYFNQDGNELDLRKAAFGKCFFCWFYGMIIHPQARMCSEQGGGGGFFYSLALFLIWTTLRLLGTTRLVPGLDL